MVDSSESEKNGTHIVVFRIVIQDPKKEFHATQHLSRLQAQNILQG